MIEHLLRILYKILTLFQLMFKNAIDLAGVSGYNNTKAKEGLWLIKIQTGRE